MTKSAFINLLFATTTAQLVSKDKQDLKIWIKPIQDKSFSGMKWRTENAIARHYKYNYT
jgi:hypothetical protein